VPAPSASSAAVAAPAAWWRNFNDPLLEGLVAEAVAAAPDVRTALARLAEARARRDLAVAQRRPSLALGATATRSRGSAAAGGSGRTRELFDAGFDASWEADLFGRLRSGAEAAEADWYASAASLADARVSLMAEVARRYFEIGVLQRRVAVAEAALRSQQGVAELAEWRARSGLASQLESLQARATLEQTRAQLPALSSALAQARQGLAVLLGKPPAALEERLAAMLPLPQPGTPAGADVALGIPADTLRQRADVRAAGLQWLAEAARTEQARAALAPRLTLSGSLGVQALTLGALTGGQATTAAVAAAMTATLFDGGRLHATWQAQGAAQERAAVAYERTVLEALADVEGALVALRHARERSATLAASAGHAREAAQLARIGYLC